MPEDYGISGFDKASLPILPNPFILTVRKVKKDKGYQADTGALKQLKVIKELFNKSDSIIVATDAGREGELIFRYIYEHLKCRKPFERLWISSLTEKAIKQGFDSLKDGKEFDGLYQAAQGRSRADWLVGINATQALSISAGNGIYSLGRVQTPTLALICKRYLENKNFSIKKYWQIQLLHRKEDIDFKSISKTKWEEQKLAEDTLRSIQRHGTATVVSVESKNTTEQPPLLFDLTGLQKEANKKLNLSAEQTLNIAQSLYEQKFITYPRTGSKYIPEDMWAEIPNLVRALQDNDTFKQATSKLKWGRFNKRIVNDLRVTDHHGLLITDKIPSALNADETKVYNMIAFRLLEALSQACVKEVTDIALEVSHYDFTLKGCKIVEAGWRSIKGTFSDDDTEPIQDLPELKKGDELKIKEASCLEKKTKPPVLFTEAGLLSAMENAGREIENEDERKALQHIGIGTPATRAAIIETLFTRNYIQREKKSLIPTEKGLQVYGLVKERKIADVAMTAEWELALQKIENNEVDARVFLREMETYAKSITDELLQTSIANDNLPKLTCPKCKSQQLIIRDKIVKCPDEHCNWVQFRRVCEVQLSIADITNLVNNGKTPLIKGMKSKAGKKFDAYIVLNENSESSFEFEKKKSTKAMENKPTIVPKEVSNLIYTIRDKQVMLDSDLATLYQVETKILNKAVKRNLDRFPDKFCFQLTDEESDFLRFQIGTSNVGRGGRRYLPYVFTEQGIAMLSAVLRSDVAVRVSIEIMDAFVEMRRMLISNASLFHRLDKIEIRQLETDQKIEEIFKALESDKLPSEKGTFYNGQVFDAYKFVADIIRSAESSIIPLDNYADDTVLTLLGKRKDNVTAKIYTKAISNQLRLDVQRYNSQYPPIEIEVFSDAHDRFLIIDQTELYHIGASLKDLGKKWFAFSRMDIEVGRMLQLLYQQ